MSSIFAAAHEVTYPYRYQTTLRVGEIRGGVPSDPAKIEAWIRKNLGEQTDQAIAKMVTDTMADLGLSLDDAVKAAARDQTLNCFKRLPSGELCVEGRQVKAMIKEAANINWPKRRWGESNKGTRSFIAEHVFVVEDKIGLGVTEPSGIAHGFVHTFRGSSFKSEEFVEDAKVSFTVISDREIDPADWATLWVTAEMNGLGASRSQGAGRFQVDCWEKVA